MEKAPRSVKEFIADGIYDTKSCREAIAKKGARAIICPIKGSIIGKQRCAGSELRDEVGQIIRALGNDKEVVDLWKKLIRYGRRSLVETFFLD